MSPCAPWPDYIATTPCSLSLAGPVEPTGTPGSLRLNELAADLGVADRVMFVPPKPHHLLSSYYRAADVVIVPSRSESFGLVALEAAACGIPVVASAVGGLLNVVHDGVTGLLVEGRQPERFSRALAQVLDDPVGAAAMGDSGRGASATVHLEFHGRPVAPPVRGPHRAAHAPRRVLTPAYDRRR